MKKLSLLLAGAFIALGSVAQNKGQFTMTTNTYKNNELSTKTPVVTQFHIMNDEVATVMKDGEKKTTVIMNPATQVVITLEDIKGKKTGMKMKMPAVLLKGNRTDDALKITPTGETQVINGMNCSKYTFENSEYTGYMWMTNDINWNYSEFADKMVRMTGGRSQVLQVKSDITGFPVLVYQQEKKGKNAYETTYSSVVVGNCNEDLFSTTGYEVNDITLTGK